MRARFPEPPNYGFSWRNILVEPVSFSGERISLAAILKTDDGVLVIPKFVARRKLHSLFGEKYGNDMKEALELCIECAEEHFRRNPIYSSWKPPMKSFSLGKAEHSTADDLEEAVLVAGRYCSSINMAEQIVQQMSGSQKSAPASRQWETKIKENVGHYNTSFENCFDAKISLKEGGVKVKVGFISEKYAAQFEAISSSSAIQHTLVRAQAKLWQLDLLRDEESLFKIPDCELLLGIPQPEVGKNDKALREFVEELEFEASRRELSVYTTSSPAAAASHVIERAAA